MEVASSSGKFLELNEQRKDKSLCDVTFLIEDEEFHCHRNVLAASSEYFAVMFDGNFVESTMSEIRLEIFNKTVYSSFFDLAYTGKTMLFNMDNIGDILVMSSVIMSDLLEKTAVDFMKHDICMSTIIKYAKFSTTHRLTFLSAYCVDYVCDNFTEILQNDNIFLHLPFNIFQDVLAVVDVNEKIYVKILIRWLSCDTKRFKFIEKLSKTIRFADVDAFRLLLTEIPDNVPLRKMLRKCFNKFSISDEITNELYFLQLDVLINPWRWSVNDDDGRFSMESKMFYHSRNFYHKESLSTMRLDFAPSDLKVALLNNEHIYVWFDFIGFATNFVYHELCSLTKMKWNQASCQSKPLQSMIGVNEKNKIYSSVKIAASPLLYCYDAIKDVWNDIIRQKNNEIYGQCLVSNNDGTVIYLCGGAVDGLKKKIPQSDMTIYDDRDKNQFQNVGKLVQGCYDSVATIHNNSIYVINKRFLFTTEGQSESIVQRYDINAGKSELMEPIKFDGYHHPIVSAATYKDKIWISFNGKEQVHYYDERRNIWKPKNCNAFKKDGGDIFMFPTQLCYLKNIAPIT